MGSTRRRRHPKSITQKAQVSGRKMDITFEFGRFLPSSDSLALIAKDLGILDAGICCPLRVVRPDGFVPGVAWPSVRSDGEILVGMAALQVSDCGLSRQQAKSTWRHNEAALRKAVAQNFKRFFEEGKNDGSLQPLLFSALEVGNE